jgi:glycosyltransferase involved in cell wall biosynthesis
MAMLCRISRNWRKNLGSSENIWFVGWVSDLDTYFRYLSTADICVAPEPSNQYNDESTFVKIMEYMLAGKPIVAFDLPETRFSAEGAASYASPNNHQDFAAKLAALMDDKALRVVDGRTRPATNRNQAGVAALHPVSFGGV